MCRLLPLPWSCRRWCVGCIYGWLGLGDPSAPVVLSPKWPTGRCHQRSEGLWLVVAGARCPNQYSEIRDLVSSAFLVEIPPVRLQFLFRSSLGFFPVWSEEGSCLHVTQEQLFCYLQLFKITFLRNCDEHGERPFHSFVFFAVDETRRIFLSPFVLKTHMSSNWYLWYNNIIRHFA